MSEWEMNRDTRKCPTRAVRHHSGISGEQSWMSLLPFFCPFLRPLVKEHAQEEQTE
jgi:hypothetical protein